MQIYILNFPKRCEFTNRGTENIDFSYKNSQDIGIRSLSYNHIADIADIAKREEGSFDAGDGALFEEPSEYPE